MATSTSPVVIRSLYRSLLRSARPFSPPSPNYAVYASLLQRSGISHDWEECIYKLEKKRCKKRQDNDNGSNTDNNNNSGSKSKSENIIPKSWARNLSRSYADLREDYQNYKQSLEYHDFDDDEEEDDDWADEVPIMGSSSLFHDQGDAYNVDQDPKFILFRHLLREWFAGGGDTSKDEAVDKDNSWPRQWSPDEEGYYENGKIKQVPLMRFPSQIMDCDGLSIRQIIQREFRAPSVQDKDKREYEAKEAEGKTSAAANSSKVVYPPSSYIDDPIRLQTAFLTLQELNRKLAWAEKIGLHKPREYEANRRAIEWKRLVQAAKGVSKFPLSTGGKACDEVEGSSPSPVEGEYDTKSNDDEPPRSSKDNKTPSSTLDCGTLLIAHPLMTGYFANSVIILLDHTVAPSKTGNEETSNTTNESKSSGGTYGLIINRLALETSSAESTQSRLEILRQRFEEKKERDLAEILLRANDEVSTEKAANDEVPHKPDVISMSTTSNARRPISLLQAVSNDDLPEAVRLAFGDAPIREGGPVNLSLQMIHRAAEQSDLDSNPTDKDKCKSQGNTIGGTVIPSNIEPDNETERTFFGGDVMKASYAVLEGVKDADDFSFIIGASCWSPGQLENEIQRGCWLPFCGPSSMAMSGMCEHYETRELGQLCSDHDGKDEENISSSKETKLSSFPPRPSNAANLSVAGSAARGSNNTQQSLNRPAGNLWLSIMCALSQGEADLAYVMLDSQHLKDELGDSCDNFYR
jgi:hypothetical protein